MKSEFTDVDETTVHSVLNYCLTQCAVTKKSLNSTMQIPYEVIAASNNLDLSKYPGTALQIKMSFSWVELEDDENVEIENE